MATAKNDITGDSIKTKGISGEYSNNFEGIDWSIKLDSNKVPSDKPVESSEGQKR